MSLISEPIVCSLEKIHAHESCNNISSSPRLVQNSLVPGILDKPPIYKKMEHVLANNENTLELNLNLYTITENSSEENTRRSQLSNEACCGENDIFLEDIEEIQINAFEKQTDSVLQNLHKEQAELSEIVGNIDKLFQCERENNESLIRDDMKYSQQISGEQHKISEVSIKLNGNKVLRQQQYQRGSASDTLIHSARDETDTPSWMSANQDASKDLKQHVPSTYGDIVTVLEQLEKDVKPELISGSSTSSVTSTNYQDLLSYLDEIDESCVNSLQAAKKRIHSVTEVAGSSIKLQMIPRLEDLARHTNVELARYVMDLTVRLEEKSASVTLLQEEMSKVNRLTESMVAEHDRSTKQKVAAERNRYELVVRRHQSFIDQLVADKKELNNRCEQLMAEMKLSEGRHVHSVQAAEQRHKIELKRCKEMYEAAEKVKRDKWMELKTKRIKELTVKSVEQEIQTMKKDHECEVSNLRAQHQREIEGLELCAARRTQQQCEALREQLTSERENAIASEREALRLRFEKLVESEERSYQEQRLRLKSEHEGRLKEHKCRESALEMERDAAIKEARADCEERLQTMNRRHEGQINSMKETLRLELDVWKTNYRKQQNVRMAEMESRIRSVCKKERDRDIELVIDRLERDTNKSKEQSELAAQNRIRRLTEKYQQEMKNIDKSEQDCRHKCETLLSAMADRDKTIISLKSLLSSAQVELAQHKQVSQSLTADRCQIKECIEKEFHAEMETLQNQLKQLKFDKETELQALYTRIKQTISRKDDQIKKLTQDNLTLHEKCQLLENLLEQQRKDYLIR